jgi:hypothetical protein
MTPPSPGLDQHDRLVTDRVDAPPLPAFVNATPWSISWAETTTNSLRAAYGLTSMAPADLRAGFHAHQFAKPGDLQVGGISAFHDIVDPPSTVAAVRVDFNNLVDASGGRFGPCGRESDRTPRTRTGNNDVTGLGTLNGVLCSCRPK